MLNRSINQTEEKAPVARCLYRGDRATVVKGGPGDPRLGRGPNEARGSAVTAYFGISTLSMTCTMPFDWATLATVMLAVSPASSATISLPSGSVMVSGSP